MFTFQALEDYLKEYEETLYNDYMRAKKAKEDWIKAYRNKTLDFYNAPCYSFKWISCSTCMVTDKVREERATFEGKNYDFILDYRIIDGISYEEVVAVLSINEDGTPAFVGSRVEKQIEKLHDGFSKFLNDRHVYPQDIKLVDGRDETWIRNRAHKDAEAHRKWIEMKIKKICEDVAEVAKISDGWLIKGTNSKEAHLWFITAGGWNVQRLHSRCLVKEIKNKK